MTTQLFSTLAVGVILTTVLFSAVYIGFKQGLRLGMTTAKGELPKVENPVKTVVTAYKEHKETKELEEELKEIEDVMSYDYEKALENVRKQL